MALSAEKILMIGVGALGIYAVYRLATAPKMQVSPSPSSTLPPVEPSIPIQDLPERAGPIGAPPPEIPFLSGPVLHLTNSRAYRGRLELDPNATDDDVRNLLASLGLEGVIVFARPDLAAPNVPDFALLNPGRGTRWFHARYLGATRDVPRPPELAAMWIVSGTPVRAIAGWR